MSRNLRREIPIPLGWFLVLCFGLCISWVGLVFMGEELYGKGELGEFGFAFLGEIVKAGAFGGVLAALLQNRFEVLFEEGPEAILRNLGIQNIHPSRERVADDLVQWIRDPKTTQVSIIGISLRDFLPPGGRLHHAWKAIRDRLESEQSRTPPPLNRLRVKLLLLDPRSAEGIFRYNVERKSFEGGNLQKDVQISVEQYENALARIYRSTNSEFLELRLYEHCSFAFLVLTDEHALVEQYCYRDQDLASAFPLLQYPRKSQSYAQMEYSFEVMWDHAHRIDESAHGVGTAKAIRAADISNIFRIDDGGSLRARKKQSILSAQEGQEVRISAITAPYYLRDIGKTLKEVTSRKVIVKLLISNPVSEGAILRAITEKSESARVRELLKSWDWRTHCQSQLYHEATNAINTVKSMREKGHSIELHLTPVFPTCAMLQTPQAVFIEQYLLGRSRQPEGEAGLGGAFPVFEFAVQDHKKTIEEEIVNSTFDLLWNHLSLSIEEYSAVDDGDQFKTNLNMLRASLAPAEQSAELETEGGAIVT